MINQSPFTALKRNVLPEDRHNPVSGNLFYFALKTDDFGAFVEILDHKNRIVSADENRYSGSKREALQLYNQLKDRRSWQIEWGREEDRIYLEDHPRLVDILLSCDNLLTPEGELVQNTRSNGSFLLKSSRKNNQTDWRILFLSENKKEFSPIIFLTSSMVQSGKNLFSIEPIHNYADIDLFNCSLDEGESENLISLFLSTFPSINVEHLDYTIEKHGHIHSNPALVLEEVDELGTLYLNLSTSAEGVDFDFLNNYKLKNFASIDNDRMSVKISTLENCDISNWTGLIEKSLKKYCNKKEPAYSYERVDNLFIIQPKLALQFLESELHLLLSDFILIGSEHLKKFKIKTVHPKMNLRIGSGIDFLEGKADLTIDDEKFDLSLFLQEYEKNRYIKLSDGTRGIVEHRFFNRIKRLLKPSQNGNFSISFFDLPLINDLIDEKTAEKGFLESRRIIQGFNSIHDNPPPLPELKATLRDYQIKGYSWLSYLMSNNLGGCLADDMGLGKTIQAISLLSTIYPSESEPSLVIMPKSLLYNWESEVKRFAPSISTVVYHGTSRKLKEGKKANLLLTTYATVRQDIEQLKEMNFAYIVLDESQNIKNTNSKISKAVMLLNSRWKLALSGTPVENNLGELYSFFRFLNPAMFGSAPDFQADYYDPIVKDGDEHALKDLKMKIYPFLLRRLKGEVLDDLPDKTEQIIYVDMSPEHKKLYEKRRQFYHEAIKMKVKSEGFGKSRFFLFQALNELRQLAGIPEIMSDRGIVSPKKEVLLEYLREVIGNGHKVLLFANYLEALNIMEEALENENIGCLKMTGSTTKRERIVDSFQNGNDYQVLLMTLKTGGVGLNLTAADYVFIFDPWWNAAVENQAVDRVHRIGQKNSVFSYKVITKDTIEEKILQLQQNKTELVSSLIDSDGDGIKSLSEDDIDFIFSDSRQ